MAALRKINDRNQITLPADVLREAGVPEGALFSIVACDGKIVLEPKRLADEDFTSEEWDALDRLVRKQTAAGQYTEFDNPKDALRHLRRPRR